MVVRVRIYKRNCGFYGFILFLLLGASVISCQKEEISSENPLSIKLGENDLENYIIVLSEQPQSKSPQAKKVLDNLPEMLDISEKAVGYKYKKALTGFSARLSSKKVKELEKNSAIKSIVKDIMLKQTSLEVGQQNYPIWGLDRIDQRGFFLDNVYGYNATGEGVTVYIVDTGINFSHEEFEGRASLGHDFVLELDPANTDGSQGPGEDCHGHGSHVAATVAGKTYGVAKNANLVSVRVFGCSGEIPESRVLAAVDWITANAKFPAVVNMSLGGPVIPEVEPMEDAIRNSVASGITYVVAAGNDRIDACDFSPARMDEVITVGASDIENKMAYFSNYGSCLDVFAPGFRILSASKEDDTSAVYMSGTSMASPHVAGIAALYLEANPSATPVEVTNAIMNNSTPDAITEVPEGTNNLAHSLWQEINITKPEIGLEVLAYKEKGTTEFALTWNVSKAPLVDIIVDGRRIAETSNTGLYFYNTSGKAPDNFQVCEKGVYNSCSKIVSSLLVNDPLLLPNETPEAIFGYQSNGLEYSFVDYSRDNDGEIVSWSWDFGDGSTSTLQNPVYEYATEGTYFISLGVTDDRGGTASYQRYVKVEAIAPPQPVELQLLANLRTSRGRTYADLSWTPSGTSDFIEIYRNGSLYTTIPNDGDETLQMGKGSGFEIIKVCIPDSSYCSNEITVDY